MKLVCTLALLLIASLTYAADCDVFVDYKTNQESRHIEDFVSQALKEKGFEISPYSNSNYVLSVQETSGSKPYISLKLNLILKNAEGKTLDLSSGEATLSMIDVVFNPDNAALKTFEKASKKALKAFKKNAPTCL